MIEFKDITWRHYHGALIPAVAPHIGVNLTQKEQKELLKLSKAYFIRYVTDFDIKQESSFWYVIKDESENLEHYKSKMRNQIRKGLTNCRVEKVDSDNISKNGYSVYLAAFKKYKTDIEPKTKEAFTKDILHSKSQEFWAVYKKGEERLVAYSQNSIEDDSVNYSTIKLHPDYLKYYPSYALIFKMNEYYLNEKKVRYVNDGARSISHMTNIQNFLIDKFNFRKAYCKLHIVYRWDIGMIVRLLYPLRKLIDQVDYKVFNRLSVLLKQEEIRRSYER
jgi:hypothetical protein